MLPILYKDSIKDRDDGIIDHERLMLGLWLVFTVAKDVVEELAEKNAIALDQNDRVSVLTRQPAQPDMNNGYALIYWIVQFFEGSEPMVADCSRETLLLTLHLQLEVLLKRAKLRAASTAHKTACAVVRLYPGPPVLY